jgi:hypothetical protein
MKGKTMRTLIVSIIMAMCTGCGGGVIQSLDTTLKYDVRDNPNMGKGELNNYYLRINIGDGFWILYCRSPDNNAVCVSVPANMTPYYMKDSPTNYSFQTSTHHHH